MHPDERRRVSALLLLGLPSMAWFIAVQYTEPLRAQQGWPAMLALMRSTPERPVLLAAAVGGLVLALLMLWALSDRSPFGGAPFRRFLRGTKLVSARECARITRERGERQVTVAGVPMPGAVEPLHLLVNGATGSGKSVVLRELAFSAMARGDRLAIVDPNGDMLAKFGRPGDVILNPYDDRTPGWSFFNEIRADYDWHRYALSVIPRGSSSEAESWNGYARLLLRETARKLAMIGQPSIDRVFKLTTIVPPGELREFLEGTDAESLFVEDAKRALASARFVLSDKLPGHRAMPPGAFSLRDWLESSSGNLYITWREDMAEAMRPLVSAWVDTLCTSVLSLPVDPQRRLWLMIDELASMEKLASLEPALTKGRKHGLRVVAGLQSTSQLDSIYGREDAQTLRACFRSLVVLGGAKTDPQTAEDMSRALGEHEVERDKYSRNYGQRRGTSKSPERNRERIVMPSEIASLPDLSGYVSFAGDLPVAKVTAKVQPFIDRVPAFVERGFRLEG